MALRNYITSLLGGNGAPAPGALSTLDLTTVAKTRAAEESAADVAKRLGHADAAIASIGAGDPSAYVLSGGASTPTGRLAEAPVMTAAAPATAPATAKPAAAATPAPAPAPVKPAAAPAPAPAAAKPAAEPTRVAASTSKVPTKRSWERDKKFMKRLGNHVQSEVARGTLDAHGQITQSMLTNISEKLAAGEHGAAKEAYSALVAHQKEGAKLAKEFKTPGRFMKWGKRGLLVGGGAAAVGVAYNLLKRPDISQDKERIADLNDKIAENEAKLTALQTMQPQQPVMQQPIMVAPTPQGPVSTQYGPMVMVPANNNIPATSITSAGLQYQGQLAANPGQMMGAPA